MSIAAFTRTNNCSAGMSSPHNRKLQLMGIRFADAGGDGAGAGDGDGKGGDGYTPPATQADLDKILESRLARERQSAAAELDKFKDYDDLKAQAAELARLKNEKATPDEKLAAQIAAAREEGKNEGKAESSAVLADERVNNALTAALNGRVLNPNVLVLGFDKKQFIKDNGADTEAIKTWVEANSTEVKSGNGRDPGQGGRDSRATGGSVQAGRDRFDDENKPKRKE